MNFHKLVFLLAFALCGGSSAAPAAPQDPTSAPTTEPTTAKRITRWDQVPRVAFLYGEHVKPIQASEQARVVDAAMQWGPAGKNVWFVVMMCEGSAEVYFVPAKPEGRLRKGKFVVVTWDVKGYDVPGDINDYWDVAPPGKSFVTSLTVPAEFDLSLPFAAPGLPEQDVVRMVDSIRLTGEKQKSLDGQRIGWFARNVFSLEVYCQSWEYSGSTVRLVRRGNGYQCELSGLWVSP